MGTSWSNNNLTSDEKRRNVKNNKTLLRRAGFRWKLIDRDTEMLGRLSGTDSEIASKFWRLNFDLDKIGSIEEAIYAAGFKRKIVEEFSEILKGKGLTYEEILDAIVENKFNDCASVLSCESSSSIEY
jgi:hypothetical protein